MGKIFLILFLLFGGLFIYMPAINSVAYAQEDQGFTNEDQQNDEQNQSPAPATTQPKTSNIDNNAPNPSMPGTSSKLLDRFKSTWPWYLTRAAGLTAAFFMSILILSGIGFITGHTFKFLEPVMAWATHRAIGIALGVSVLLHMAGLFIDKVLPFSLVQIFVPFTSTYKPVTIAGVHLRSLYVALGIFAFYLLLLIILTSLILINKKPKLWKTIHISTYIVGVFVFFHALYVGTDLQNILVRYVWLAVGVVILLAAIVRSYRMRTV